jgi:hypothetical protein
MRNKKDLVEELNWLTDKISSQVWTLNLGTLATTWSLLIAAGNVEKLRIGGANAIPIMGLCILAMLCELVQYLAGYVNARSICTVLRTVDAQNLNVTGQHCSIFCVRCASTGKSH